MRWLLVVAAALATAALALRLGTAPALPRARGRPVVAGDARSSPPPRPPNPPDSGSVPVPAEPATERAAEREAGVTGWVRGDDGNAIEEGSVLGAFRRCDGGFARYYGRGSVKHGVLRFDWCPWPGKRVGPILRIRAGGYIPLVYRGSDAEWERVLARRSLAGLEIVMRRAAVVEGVVRFDGSVPLTSAKVGLTKDPFARTWDIMVTHAVPAGGPGRWFVLAEIDPGAAADLHLVAVAVLKGLGRRHIPSRPLRIGDRLRRGETTRVDVLVEEDRSVEIDLIVRGWEESLRYRLDDGFSFSAVEGPRVTLHGRTGVHRLLLRRNGDDGWSHTTTFTIPHDQTRYQLVVDPGDGRRPVDATD